MEEPQHKDYLDSSKLKEHDETLPALSLNDVRTIAVQHGLQTERHNALSTNSQYLYVIGKDGATHTFRDSDHPPSPNAMSPSFDVNSSADTVIRDLHSVVSNLGKSPNSELSGGHAQETAVASHNDPIRKEATARYDSDMRAYRVAEDASRAKRREDHLSSQPITYKQHKYVEQLRKKTGTTGHALDVGSATQLDAHTAITEMKALKKGPGGVYYTPGEEA